MGSKFRGVKQTPKEKAEVVLPESTANLSGSGEISISDLKEMHKQLEVTEQVKEVKPAELTDTVYTFAKLKDSRHYRLLKIDFNPETGDAKVVGIQETEHQASGHVHEHSQYGLKIMFDRKTKGSVYDAK